MLRYDSEEQSLRMFVQFDSELYSQADPEARLSTDLNIDSSVEDTSSKGSASVVRRLYPERIPKKRLPEIK